MSLRNSAVSGVRWATVSMSGVTLMETTRLIVLGRLLPPSAFGLMTMMIVAIGFGQILSQMGLAQAVIQRPVPKDDELVSLYWLNITAGFCIYGLLIAATPIVAAMYSSPELKSMLPYMGIIFLCNPLGDLYRAILEKKMHFKHLAGVEILGVFVGMVMSIALALNGFGVWSLIWGQLATVAFRNIGFFVLGQKMFRPRFHFRKDDLQGYLRFGLNHLGAQSLNYINSRIDQLLIGAILGPQVLGYYSMAFNLIMSPVQRINPVLTRVAFPVLAKVQGDKARMRRGYFKMLNILTSVNAPILIGVSAVAPVAVPIILGQKWLPVVPIMQILAFFSLVRATGNAGGSMVLAMGRADISFYWNILLFCFIPIVVFFAAHYGDLTMIAWALLGLQILLFFLWYVLVVKKLLGKCFLDYIRATGIPVLVASAMGIMVVLIFKFIPMEKSALNLGFQIFAGGVIYIGFYLLFAWDELQEHIRLLLSKD